MTTTETVQLDRARIKELTERESRKLDERTPKSRELFERAKRTMPSGVASTYQARKPWPIFLTRGEGQHVWDADGHRMVDYHNGFGSMVVGHAHPAIVRAVSERVRLGSHFSAPTEDATFVAEDLARRFALPKWRFTNSGTEATMDAIRIARGVTGRDTIVKILGSYHGHHDAVMVAVGFDLGAGRGSGHDPLESLRRGASAGGRGPDGRRAVQRRGRALPPARPARGGGAAARLHDHGGGDDEPRGRAPRARLSGGRP